MADREPLDFRGEFWSHTLMPPLFNPGPNPYGPPPIALGGLGPQMLRLAAEVGDAVFVMPFNTRRTSSGTAFPPLRKVWPVGAGIVRRSR
jgi:alkanesulfonate monooxygenase SsuD/methylene tetrahydromethanopterin reductase-like flavin-dependent oxidoreductase (luciferase family)